MRYVSRSFGIRFCALAALLLLLCSYAAECDAYDIDAEMKKKKLDGREAAQPPVRPRLAVALFEDRSGSGAPGEAITDMMTTELVSADLFTIVERDKISMSIAEQELVESGYGDADTAPEAGRLMGAEFSMTGAITEYRYDTAAGALPIGKVGVAIGSHTATVMLDVRIVNNRTGEVVAVFREKGSSNQTVGGLVSRYGGFGGGKTGGILAGATHKVVLKIIERIKAEGLPKMQAASRGNVEAESASKSANVLNVDAQFTQATIDVGLNANIRKGALFAVYRSGNVIKDLNGNILGEEKIYVGILQVTDAQAAYSTCKVLKGKGFQRGDKVQRIRNADDVVITPIKK